MAFLLLAAFKVIRVDFKGKSLKLLLATAIFEPVGYFIFETVGIGYTTATVAGIIAASAPIFVMILEALVLKEKTTLTQKLFLVISILGVFIVTVFAGDLKTGGNSLIGIFSLFAAHIFGALFFVCSRKSSARFSTFEITFFTTMTGAVAFNLINIVRHLSLGTITSYFKPLMNIQNIIGLLFLSIASSIVATMMGNYGLSKIQASSVSALGGISTITSIVLGVLVNNEVLRWYHIVGAILILTGGIGINKLAKNKNNSAATNGDA